MLLKALSSIALLSTFACVLLVGTHDEVIYDLDRLTAMMRAAGSAAPAQAYLLMLIGGIVGGVLVMRQQPKLAATAVVAFSIPFTIGVLVLLAGPLLNSPSLVGAQTAITLCLVASLCILGLYALLFVRLFSGLQKRLPGVLAGFRR